MDLQEFISVALAEDIGNGDHTSLSCIPNEAVGSAKLLVKDHGILAGMKIAEAIFKTFDKTLKFEKKLDDGDTISPGDIAFLVHGKSQSILTTERLVLNCMQRMSGIATQTHKITSLVKDLPVKILDTRKTTPCMRLLEKQAVLIGGGFNHRFGLYDMMMIKDNHADYAGGIKKAIAAAKEYIIKKNLNIKIEVEARNIDEVNEILLSDNVYRILLDNFKPEKMKETVALINRRIETEASGGITIDNVREYALTGVDYISMGALTHSVKSLDLSLKAI
jgi:nicotinate-nucleotide pyrophosphorylase (carboxylating)